MPRVIVIGAGISGLAAAWRLRRGGIEAVVLERSDRPGGRIHTVHVNDCVMEVGAHVVGLRGVLRGMGRPGAGARRAGLTG
jgi:oxygen-dependent protoporphyrinogen oxidase